MSAVLGGALCGLGLALGVLLVLDRFPPMRRPRLADRLEPYLRDDPSSSRLLTGTGRGAAMPTAQRLLGPVVRDGVRWLERTLGGAASVHRRLERAGGRRTLEQFRVEQLAWGGVGLAGGVFVSVLLASRGSYRPLPLLVLCLCAAVSGVLARDRWLSREAERREQQMMLEFPTVAELLALAVTAGEGAVGALARVSALGRGELSVELRRALADTRAGASLVVALQGVADRSALPALARFADGVAVAIERGTPLADVLRAQAIDVREAGRRALLEAGGRKEIAMMIPVVFLVLPVTVLFALFPGFLGFSFSS
jgi:tight adherence protein C